MNHTREKKEIGDIQKDLKKKKSNIFDLRWNATKLYKRTSNKEYEYDIGPKITK